MLHITFLQKSIAIWLSNPFEVLGSLSVLQQDKVCLPGSLHAAAKQKSTQRPQVPGFGFVFLSIEKSPEFIPQWRAASRGCHFAEGASEHEKGHSMVHITVSTGRGTMCCLKQGREGKWVADALCPHSYGFHVLGSTDPSQKVMDGSLPQLSRKKYIRHQSLDEDGQASLFM